MWFFVMSLSLMTSVSALSVALKSPILPSYTKPLQTWHYYSPPLTRSTTSVHASTMGGGGSVPSLTDFDALESTTKDLTMEQLNEERRDRERESIGIDKVFERATITLGKVPCAALVQLIAKLSPGNAAALSEKDKTDMETLCPIALDTVWKSTDDKDWASFFTVLEAELGPTIAEVDKHMNEAILYVNEFPESFIKSLIIKYGNSNLVPRKAEVFKDNKGGKIHYTAALIAVLLAQTGNDYEQVVRICREEVGRVEKKGFGN